MMQGAQKCAKFFETCMEGRAIICDIGMYKDPHVTYRYGVCESSRDGKQ